MHVRARMFLCARTCRILSGQLHNHVFSCVGSVCACAHMFLCIICATAERYLLFMFMFERRAEDNWHELIALHECM